MKNRQAIYLLLAANAVSGFAQGISMIAIPWHFAHTLGKPWLLGIVYGAVTACTLFWGLYAGTLIDRYNRKKVYMVTSLAGGGLQLLTAFTGFWLGYVPVPLVIAAFAGTFFIFNIHYPNLYAFAQEIAERKHYGRVTSYIEVQGQATHALAGGIGAVLLAGAAGGFTNLFGFQVAVPFELQPWSLAEVFLLDALTYFLSFGIVVLIRFVPVAQRVGEHGNLWIRLRKGLQFLIDNRLIFLFGVASYGIFVTVLVGNYFLFPVYIDGHLQADAGVYGAFEMYVAVGAVLAGLGVRKLFGFTNTVFGVIVMTWLTAGLLTACVFNTSITLFYVIAFLYGFSNSGTRVMRITYLFHHIPNQVIGRCHAVFQVINVVMRMLFIGLFSLPLFSGDGRVIYAFAVFGVFLVLSAGVLMGYYARLKEPKVT